MFHLLLIEAVVLPNVDTQLRTGFPNMTTTKNATTILDNLEVPCKHNIPSCSENEAQVVTKFSNGPWGGSSKRLQSMGYEESAVYGLLRDKLLWPFPDGGAAKRVVWSLYGAWIYDLNSSRMNTVECILIFLFFSIEWEC